MKYYLPLALAVLLLAPVSGFAAETNSSAPSPMKPAEAAVSSHSQSAVEESSQAQTPLHDDKLETKPHHPTLNTTPPASTPTESAPEKSSFEGQSEPIQTSAKPGNQNLKQLFNQFHKEPTTQAQAGTQAQPDNKTAVPE